MPKINQRLALSPHVEKQLSQNKKMIKALKAKGLDIEDIAGYIKEQVECNKFIVNPQNKTLIDVPDNSNRNRALEMVVHIVDTLPSTKHEIEENRNINIHITTDSAERSVEAANMDVIDCDEWEEESSEFLK